MTAIAGLLGWRGQQDAAERCGRMMAAQRIYGSGAVAVWAEDGCAIGRDPHRAEQDVAGAPGPLIGSGGALVLAADLRLENRDELRETLGLTGRLSDAAVLLAALEQWGEGAAERVAGEFAFALWDRRERMLTLARDYLGQRPLHVAQGPGWFAFASMPRGLHALAEVRRAPDLDSIVALLGYLPDEAERSFFAGVGKVTPGSVMRVSGEGMTRRRFWSGGAAVLRPASQAEAQDMLREQMDRAVSGCLGTRTAVAAQLSGGIDSSTVTATAARALAETGSVVAYTSVPRSGFPTVGGGRILDEGPLAALTAARYPNVDHVKVKTPSGCAVDVLWRGVELYERPVLNCTNEVWLGAINDDARGRGLEMMLHGSMGNLSFSHSGIELLAEQFGGGRLLAWQRTMRAMRRAGSAGWRTLGLYSVAPWLPRPLWRLAARRIASGASLTQGSLLRPEVARDYRLDERARSAGFDPDGRPPRDTRAVREWALGRVDIGNFTKGVLGGWGLELADPTADRRLVAFCLRLPAQAYVVDGALRGLARHAFADRLPAEVLGERRKGLQAADWAEAIVAGRERVIAEARAIAESPVAAALIDGAGLVRMAESIPAGEWQDERAQLEFALHGVSALSVGHFVRHVGL